MKDDASLSLSVSLGDAKRTPNASQTDPKRIPYSTSTSIYGEVESCQEKDSLWGSTREGERESVSHLAGITPILRDYQWEAINELRAVIRGGHKAPVLVQPTGCHAKGTEILMADGSVQSVERIAVGDLVMGPDSEPRKVCELHTGIDEMFRIVPNKGEPFVVNGDHVLSVRVTNDGSKRAGTVESITVRDWLASSKTYQHTRKLYRVGVDFPCHHGPLPVEPYMLGVLLGDGNLGYGTAIANPEPEICAAADQFAENTGLSVTDLETGQRCAAFSLVTPRGKPNPLLQHLRDLGLNGCRAHDKFIPAQYRVASHDERLDLLAGLMDTDGSLGGGYYDFISASETLARDVAFVARSVGFAAYVSRCRKCWQNGEGDYWRVSITGNVDQIPCRVPRKQSTPRRQQKNVLVTGFDVESVGIGAYFGFKCDGDHLYVLGDFTVTHNSGKTVVASEIIRSALERGSRCLFLAPRRELVSQASRKLDDAGVEHGVILSGSDEKAGMSAMVHLAGVDTILARAVRGNRLRLPDYDLIVVDEAHLAATETRRKLLARWPDAIKLGLTATPTRKDGRALGAIFDTIVDPAPVSRLTEEGYLVPARYFSVSEPDLTGVRTTAGDYNSKDLEERVNQPQLVGDVVEHWLRYAGGRRTVVFATSIRHSVALQDEFLRNGVSAEHCDARTPQTERDAVFERFRNGQTQILTNCQLASYGFDLPELSCVVIAKPTKSLVLFLQMVGRGLRPADGKNDCLVLDHSGCVHMHGFAHEPREWSLDGSHDLSSAKSRDKQSGPAKQIDCPECQAVFEAARICPECGYELKPAGKPVETIDGELVDVMGQSAPEGPSPRNWYRELLAICKERGYKQAWAAHKYREKNGNFPPFSWNNLAPLTPTEDTRRWVQSRQIAYAKAQKKAKNAE